MELRFVKAMELRFVKDDTLWYFHSPEYLAENGEDSRGDLLMVAGADVLLDQLARGKDYVDIQVDVTPIKGTGIITCIKQSVDNDNLSSGATYLANGRIFTDFQFWLCPVCTYVMGGYPDVLYFKQLNKL